MAQSPRVLEEILVDKLIDVGGMEPETAADVAFSVVEQLEDEGFFETPDDDY